jgi:hypothetical protein
MGFFRNGDAHAVFTPVPLIIQAPGDGHRVGYRSAKKDCAAASAMRFAYRHPKTAADSSTAATPAGTIAVVARFQRVTKPKEFEFEAWVSSRALFCGGQLAA